jgi:DNA-binding response OmpR family regulator
LFKVESVTLQDKLLWILEDDKGCRFVYEQTLDHRYKTQYFEKLEDFHKALSELSTGKRERPAMIIADLMLNDGNFLHHLTNADESVSALPFIVVSSIDDIDALRLCFREGALDYLTKPFKKNELLVKIENALAGLKPPAAGDSPLDKVIVVDGVEIRELTAKQMQLLSLFVESSDRTVTREQILLKVWGDTSVHPKTVDVHLYNLRRKISGFGFIIRSDGGGRWTLMPDRLDFKPRG